MIYSKYINIFIILVALLPISCSQKVSGISKLKNIPAQFASKGIVVFLDSKCEDSKSVIPVLNHINGMSDTNFTCVLMINPMNNSLNDMHKFIHDNDLSRWKAYPDEQNKIAKNNLVNQTPYVFIVNRSNQVLYQGNIINSKEPEVIAESPLIKAINNIIIKEKKIPNTIVDKGCKIE